MRRWYTKRWAHVKVHGLSNDGHRTIVSNLVPPGPMVPSVGGLHKARTEQSLAARVSRLDRCQVSHR